MRPLRLVVVALVTAMVTLALGWAARAPYNPTGTDSALLRLSWRLRSAGTETCRPRTEAELDALPVHMRSPEVCESQQLAYELIVRIDDDDADSLRVVPGGLRQDRPAYVLHEEPIVRGAHHVYVRFAQLGAALAPPPLVLDTVVHFEPGIVQLVTLDADNARLVLRSGHR